GLGNERVATIGQSRLTQPLELLRRREFRLKDRIQISLCTGRHLAQCQIKPETAQRFDDDHNGDNQSSAKARYAFVSRLLRGTHGKSTWNVSPFFNSTGFSRVVLLSIHAFSV